MDLKTVTSGNVVDAETINSRSIEVEDYINGGIELNDLLQSDWIKSRHIRPPNFYGAPAPRAEFVSGDVHYRSKRGKEETSIFWDDVIRGTTWAPIPGMSATVHVVPKTATGTAYAVVRANWYCRERNGGDASGGNGVSELEKTLTTTFMLFANGTEVDGTKQFVYRGTSYMYRMSAKCLSVSAVVKLNHGINNISIRARFNAVPGNDHYRVHIGSRHMVCEVFYL